MTHSSDHSRRAAQTPIESINDPASLEGRTLKQIEFDLHHAGLVRAADPSTLAAAGEDDGMKTTAMIRTADRRLAHVGIGGGAYWINVIVADADRPTDDERESAARYIRTYREGIASMFTEGPAFREAADALLGTDATPVDLGRRSTVKSVFDLLRGAAKKAR